MVVPFALKLADRLLGSPSASEWGADRRVVAGGAGEGQAFQEPGQGLAGGHPGPTALEGFEYDPFAAGDSPAIETAHMRLLTPAPRRQQAGGVGQGDEMFRMRVDHRLSFATVEFGVPLSEKTDDSTGLSVLTRVHTPVSTAAVAHFHSPKP